MSKTEIVGVIGRQVLDSRGNPTVEAEVQLSGGVVCTAISPSGASTGKYEALELRDGDMQVYGGKGVQQACKNISGAICKALRGMDAGNLFAIDHALIALDGTKNKAVLGANATLAVSMACAKAAACAQNMALFRFLGGTQAHLMPMPMMNILNGGVHAGNGLDVQEFMIVPVGAKDFRAALQMGAEVYHALAALLKKKGLSTGVGDEGGFAPDISEEKQALDLILDAISRAGYTAGTDIALALDAAASEWEQKGRYVLPKSGRTFTAHELTEHWRGLCKQYPIRSIAGRRGLARMAGVDAGAGPPLSAGRRRSLRDEHRALAARHSDGLCKRDPAQAEPDRHIDGDHAGALAGAQERLPHHHVPPFGRDGGHDHRRSRRGARRGADQDGRALPKRTRKQI